MANLGNSLKPPNNIQNFGNNKGMSTFSSSRTNSNDNIGRFKPEALSIASQVQRLAQDIEETRQSLKAVEKAIMSFTNTVNTLTQNLRRQRRECRGFCHPKT
ncbi:hypothetical protein SLEP1_g59838 [Rubroshorea leprosula]|uniref:Uncharacterized protein n=1 Tax=Rubroshorea leprosula TaxID=152421 RepID=A0AAV5MTI5_9ROSI|nr:hypothetical protein SLEP1_g59838 [Rubroshorea leprosula]